MPICLAAATLPQAGAGGGIDADLFDCLAKSLAVAMTRRRVVRLFSALPLPPAITTLLTPGLEEAAA